MSEQKAEKRANEARDAVSDIQEPKAAGHHAASQAQSSVPWVIGGAVALVAIGTAVAMKPTRRSSWLGRWLLGKAVRAAALAAVGIVTRRVVNQIIDKALPEPRTAPAPLTAE